MSDTQNPFRDDVSRFSVMFVRSIMAWNDAEAAGRSILRDMAGTGNFALMAAVTHLGNVSLRDALRSVADMLVDWRQQPDSAEIADHVDHFAKGFDTLRAYRNFYVHSLRSVGTSPYDAMQFAGTLRAVEARGKYAWIDQKLTTEELSEFMQHALRLAQYGLAIADYLGPGNALLRNPPKKSLSKLTKPIWPEQIKRQRSYLTGDR